MPYLSWFTPIGLLHLTSRTPTAKTYYDQHVAGYGDKPQRDVSVGARNEAIAYAMAITEAVAHETIERAGNERLPSKTVGQLEVHEASRGMTPPPDATIRDRREELERRWELPKGAKRQPVEEALRAILGDHFVRYETQPIDASTPRVPTDLGDAPMNMQRVETIRKVVRLTGYVAFVGLPVTVGYEVVKGEQLVAGDQVVFDIGKHGLMDRVTIASAADNDDSPLLTATFASAHSTGAIGMTGTMPYWMSARRRVNVVVDEFAAGDRELRRQVDDYMARTMRGVTTWAIVEGDASSLVPFTIGEPSIGRRALEA